MLNRLRYLGIAFGSVRGREAFVPVLFAPALVVGWMAAVFLMPDPRDPLVHYLSLLAAAGGFTTVIGQFHGALNLRYKNPPLVLAGGGVCFLLSSFCLWKEPSSGLLIRISLPLVLTGFMWFYSFYLSVFRDLQGGHLGVGDLFPNFSLPNSNGQQVTLSSMLDGKPALMVFFKGDW